MKNFIKKHYNTIGKITKAAGVVAYIATVTAATCFICEAATNINYTMVDKIMHYGDDDTTGMPINNNESINNDKYDF